MVFLNDVRSLIHDQQWFSLYELYHKVDLGYEDCEVDEDLMEITDDQANVVRILDQSCSPAIASTQILATKSLVAQCLREALSAAKTTRSRYPDDGLVFSSKMVLDESREIVDCCREMDWLCPEAEVSKSQKDYRIP